MISYMIRSYLHDSILMVNIVLSDALEMSSWHLFLDR